MKEAQARAQVTRAREHALRWIELEVTRRCPLACLHCGSSCTERQFYAEEISEREILDFLSRIDAAYGAGNILLCLTGGEPLARRDIFSLLARATEMGYKTTLVTNGFFVDEATVKLLAAAGLSTVTVSLDGLEATHDWARGTNQSFRKALNALRLLRESGWFHAVEALTCVNRRTLAELPAIETLLRDNGISRWRLTRIFPIGRALEHPDLLLDGPELKELFDFIKARRKTAPEFITYSEEGYLGCDYDFAVRDGMQHCDAGISIMTVLADGSITGCAAVDHGFIQGNIRHDDPVRLWEDGFVPFRDRTWMTRGACGTCDKFKYCRGDGMHLWAPGGTDPAPCSWHLLRHE